jgi:hypothetical protein
MQEKENIKMEKAQQNTTTEKSLKKTKEGFIKRNTPRKAKKNVFFEIESGKIVFEYGGI